MMKRILILSATIILASCSGGRNSTGYNIITDMAYSEAAEAQTKSVVFDNGQVNQQPPKNTIARGFMPHPMDQDGNPRMIKNPYKMDAYGWERGEMLYLANCAGCHGDKGKANGLVVTKGGYPKPPSFSARRWKKMDKYPSGHVFNVIKFGYGNMSSYSQQLYDIDIWRVSEYVRQKLMRGKKKKK